MKITAMVAMTMAAGMMVQAGQTKKTQITVYVQNTAGVPAIVKDQAEVLASSMFASVDVKIDWRNGQPPASGKALAMELAANTPATEKPGALAFAKPIEGVHIVVFWDRMAYGVASPQVLAHVMVHEITHILEGVSHHSESGIMKAHWTDEDQRVIRARPLTFAAVDVDLIRTGLKARASLEHSMSPAVAAE
jgi:hypothetical protein